MHASFAIDLPLALVRFILPVATVALIAYLFRLFGFGWRIYRPREDDWGRGRGDIGNQLEQLRRGDYFDYVDFMGTEIERSSGNLPEFRSLRRRYLELARNSSHLTDAKASHEMDSTISRMVSLYKDATGKEGITLSGRRRSF